MKVANTYYVHICYKTYGNIWTIYEYMDMYILAVYVFIYHFSVWEHTYTHAIAEIPGSTHI